MEEKKEIKVSLSTAFLVVAIIVIIAMGAFIYIQKTEADNKIEELENNVNELKETINKLQGENNDESDIVNDTGNVEIPNASTNISADEEKIIINYFRGVWTTDNRLFVIDYGKRFCDINESNNTREYGTYAVKDATSTSVPSITLTYTTGKILELELVQGSTSYLMSKDGTVQCGIYEGYYFGTGEGDEGIFDDYESIPQASTNISEDEQEIIDCFDGIWITYNGEKLLAIDNGKRFCDINKSNNTREYGTYTVKYENSVATITLTYMSGKIIELEYIEGSGFYLSSDDGKVLYEDDNSYYFGRDGGIFNK